MREPAGQRSRPDQSLSNSRRFTEGVFPGHQRSLAGHSSGAPFLPRIARDRLLVTTPFALGSAVEAFVRREDTERFIEETPATIRRWHYWFKRCLARAVSRPRSGSTKCAIRRRQPLAGERNSDHHDSVRERGEWLRFRRSVSQLDITPVIVHSGHVTAPLCESNFTTCNRVRALARSSWLGCGSCVVATDS
jgi:hypothetical protein